MKDWTKDKVSNLSVGDIIEHPSSSRGDTMTSEIKAIERTKTPGRLTVIFRSSRTIELNANDEVEVYR